MNFGVSLLLIGAGKLPAADITSKRLLPGVGPNVGGEVVAPAERPHADPALERLLPGVDPDMAGQLVAPGEPAVAVGHRAGVGPLVNRGFARPVGILPGPDGHQSDGQLALLVDLREDLVSFAGTRVVLGKGGG